MLPIILETTSEVDRNNFIEEFILEQKIKPYNCLFMNLKQRSFR